MHEYGIVQSLMQTVEREAATRGASAVHRISVRLGALSGVEPELLGFAFEAIREGTICAAAELSIEKVPVAWQCTGCGSALPPGGLLQCDACGAPARLVSGNEIILERIEMEVPDVS